MMNILGNSLPWCNVVQIKLFNLFLKNNLCSQILRVGFIPSLLIDNLWFFPRLDIFSVKLLHILFHFQWQEIEIACGWYCLTQGIQGFVSIANLPILFGLDYFKLWHQRCDLGFNHLPLKLGLFSLFINLLAMDLNNIKIIYKSMILGKSWSSENSLWRSCKKEAA